MAITKAESEYGNAVSSKAFTNPCGVGDLIICIGNWSTTGGTYSVTDSVNTGNYVQRQLVQNTVNAYGMFGVYSMVCNASGTPTVSLSATNSPQRLLIIRYTGFSGTPTFPASDLSSAQAASSTALNSGSFNTSVPNEYAIAWFNDNGGNLPPATANSPFAARMFGTYQLNSYDTLTDFPSGMTLSTAVALVGTLGAADSWSAGVVGFYDSIASGASVAWING